MLSSRERPDEGLYLGSNTALDEGVGWHDSDRVTKAAARLSCIPLIFTHDVIRARRYTLSAERL